MMMNNEILNIKRLIDRQVNRDTQPILRAYRNALDEVRAEIAKIYTNPRYVIDGVLNVSRQQRYTVLRNLESQLVNQAQALGAIDVEHTTRILQNVYTESFYRTAYAIDRGTSVAINFAILRPEMVSAAVNMPIEGQMFSSRIWANKELLVNRVRRSVEQAMIQGTSIDKLARDISRNFGSSAYESQRLIRTEVARCQSLAQDQIYKDSGVVEMVMYDATLDEKTSEICEELDGQYFDLHSNYPSPPQHPNCRSAIIPVVEGWSPTQKRENIAGEDGKPIIDYTNYTSWKESRGID